MNLLETLWGDLMKIFHWAPVVAAIDPNAAGGIARAEAVITALQPTVAAVSAAGTQTHAQLVDSVTQAIAASSASLTKMGLVSGATNDHLLAVVPLISAAVAASGLASDANALVPVPAVVP